MTGENVVRGKWRGKSKTSEVSSVKEQTVCCSFCGRSSDEVLKMVEGPGVNICSECVMVAVQYLVLKDTMPSEDSQKILNMFWKSNGVEKDE